MRRGRELLKSGQPSAALVHFNHFANNEKYTDTRTGADAAYMSGTVLFALGQTESALHYLQKAELFMKNVNDPLLDGKILRRRSGVYHMAAMKMKVRTEYDEAAREEQLNEAENYLYSSIIRFKELLRRYENEFERSAETPPPGLFDDIEVEIAVSEATWGLVEYERGDVAGRTRIKKAVATLVNLEKDHEIELVQSLILLMQVLPLRERYGLYEDQVHDRTTKSSPARELRKPALVALFKTSNRVHLQAIKRGEIGWKGK